MAEETAGVDVGRAAALLGITIQAVRKRARRGSLQAWKVDGEWRIAVPAAETEENAGRAAGEPVDRQPGRAGTGASGESAALDVGHAALIDELRAEVAFLRQLTEHQAGVIAQLSVAVPALPAGAAEHVASSHTDTEPSTTMVLPRKRPFWRRWQR